jgi:hypothetical protein
MAKQRAEASDRIESGNLLAYLVRSPRRTVSLQVNPDLSLVIKAPVETPEPFLRDFLERRRPWVERHLERMARIKEAAPVWADGGRVPFLGEELVLKVEAGARSRARFGVGDLFGPVVVAARDPSDAEEVRAAVERLFSREAAARFPAMLDACLASAARRRFPRPELRVRTMRSRWGSCDAKAGVVTLNARLLRFRVEVIECVIMHELAHLKYRRHGPRFYGLLEELCPEYRALQAELSEVYLE